MSNQIQTKFWKRRSRSTYWLTTISIGLVLYFLGLFAGLVLFGQDLISRAKSQMVMKVFVHDGLSETLQTELQSYLAAQPYTRTLTYVSKEAAAEEMLKYTGEDVREMLGGLNPLFASYQFQLHPDYIQSDSLSLIKNELNKQLSVAEISYQGEMLDELSQNMETVAWITVGLAIIMGIVAVFLIYATIRLSIYARRLAIRSMELMGATSAFIRRPFLGRGALQGLIGGLMATGLLILTVSGLSQQLAEIDLKWDALPFNISIGLLGGIVLFGLLLGLTGSYWAVNKYLNRNLDELM
ncbi:MAG: permease-like cell division protein FtsX [Bacteroidota bacterium]